MTAEPRNPRAGVYAAWLLVSLPLLYVGLFGPAAWLVDRGVLPTSETARLYRPLVRIANSDGAAGKFLSWYALVRTKPRARKLLRFGPKLTALAPFENVLTEMADDLETDDIVRVIKSRQAD